MPSPQTVTTPSSSHPVSNANFVATQAPSTAAYSGKLYASPPSKARLPGIDLEAGAAAAAATNHYYYHPTHKNTAAGNPTHPLRSHIPPTVSTKLPSQTFLPRTSSLLPPPRHSSVAGSGQHPTFQHQFNALQARGFPGDSVTNLEPQRAERHSRSSSTGGLSDSIRSLNRWSASTASSHGSAKTALHRRMSIDVAGSTIGTPKKLQKNRRPSTSTPNQSPRSPATTRSRRGSSPTPAPVPLLQRLPRIAILPSLELEINESTALGDFTRSAQPISNGRPTYGVDFPGDDSVNTFEEQPPAPSNTDTSGPLMAPAIITRDSAMTRAQVGESRGHTRSRSTQNGSTDTTGSAKARERSSKGPSQKAMLSKALQKANSAVEFDNAANFEGARFAYSEACELLQQVLQRTSGDEDRRKLEAIRKTYTSRIDELNELLPADSLETKALPRRPTSIEYQDAAQSPTSDSDDVRLDTEGARYGQVEREQQAVAVPIRAVNPRPSPNYAYESPREGPSASLSEQYTLQSSFSKAPRKPETLTLPRPMDQYYMPPPLSPRRTASPALLQAPKSPDRAVRSDFSVPSTRPTQNAPPVNHQRGNSHESTSWLEVIEESAGSAGSSVHSRSSSRVTRKHIRAPSGDTEAEFDAALDDAIEAAYDDGYEPEVDANEGAMLVLDIPSEEEPEDAVTRALRRVELARERVRESEREALELANERERQLRMQQQLEDEEEGYNDMSTRDFFDGNESEEEERILEEMTQGYVIEDFSFDRQSKPAVPRESDSSGLTSRTWHSSLASNAPTANTALTTVSENTVVSSPSKPPTTLPPPLPLGALPQPPVLLSAESSPSKETVRNRRLSGQNPKQLKIETTQMSPTKAPAEDSPASPQLRVGGYIAQQRQALSAGPNKLVGPFSARGAPSPIPGGTVRNGIETPPLPAALAQEGEPRSGSPSLPRPPLRKNFSSSSLRSMKSRNLSVTNIDEASDISPGTPLSNQFGSGSSSNRLPAMPSLPTPVATAFKDRINNSSTGGLYLFESDFHSPRSPGSPNPLTEDAPAALEPCPSDTSLRPFWLMRCLYQTLCHQRGGYISNKLFIPRDVWRVKGVKIKNVEDKIANCDLLTAALQRLAQTDSNDADAVLDEMQALESVLEQVQGALTRKLGNEVGVQSATALFREANAEEAATPVPRSGSVSSKGSAFSWRRLRNKNSSAGLATSYAGKGGSGGANSSTTNVEGVGKDMLLPSLPMTNHPTSRPTKRELDQVHFSGPNATYMSSLAKLFDAAQAVDQIARQVEDPGLRHADKTQVGLELCTRHAAEFFAFYICRFVLTDMMLLLDKFVKRGSEWVLT